jgi:jumonji domain-containing protein 7
LLRDYVYLYEQKYKPATYKQQEDGSFIIKDDEGVENVPWIPVDPDEPDLAKYPLFKVTYNATKSNKVKHASPVHCTVLPGQMLYLPSLWFHKVRYISNTVSMVT